MVWDNRVFVDINKRDFADWKSAKKKRTLGFKSLWYEIFEASVVSAWHNQSLWELGRKKIKQNRVQDETEKSIMRLDVICLVSGIQLRVLAA